MKRFRITFGASVYQLTVRKSSTHARDLVDAEQLDLVYLSGYRPVQVVFRQAVFENGQLTLRRSDSGISIRPDLIRAIESALVQVKGN